MKIHQHNRTGSHSLFLAVFVALATFLSSCQTTDKQGSDQVETHDTTTGDSIAGENNSMQYARMMVVAWNSANDIKSTAALSHFYADKVNYYGTEMSREEVLKAKDSFFAQNKDYHQKLEKDINIQNMPDSNKKISFIVDCTVNGEVIARRGSLIIARSGIDWKIIAEENEKVNLKNYRSMSENEINSCDKAAEAIFLSSAKVQKLLGLKYAGYHLEYRPGDKENPDNRYWFWVYANPPANSATETLGRYEVDPVSGQLFEYDVVADKSHTIGSDAGLKKYLKKYCGSK